MGIAGFGALIACALAAPLLALSEEAREHRRERLISQWYEANSKCRGRPPPESHSGCSDRKSLDAKLERLGWCYGQGASTGAEAVWRPCASSAELAERASAAEAPPPRISGAPSDPLGDIAPDPAAFPLSGGALAASQDRRPLWLVDEERGCIPGDVAMVSLSLSQMRDGFNLRAIAALDGEVVVLKLLYEGKRRPIRGMSMYVSDPAYCYTHFSAMVSDMAAVSWGQESSFRAYLPYADETAYMFPVRARATTPAPARTGTITLSPVPAGPMESQASPPDPAGEQPAATAH